MIDIVELLAEYCHDKQWTGWMQYESSMWLGGNVVPAELASRWKRQMNTPYAELPDEEKELDRVEAKGILEFLYEQGAF